MLLDLVKAFEGVPMTGCCLKRRDTSPTGRAPIEHCRIQAEPHHGVDGVFSATMIAVRGITAGSQLSSGSS